MPAGAGYDLQLLPFPLELYLIPLSAFFIITIPLNRYITAH